MIRFIYVSLYFIIAIVLISCKNGDNYQKSLTGFQYKIISKNPKGTAVSEGDVLSLKLKYYTQSDSLLFNSDELPAKFRVQVSNAEIDGMMQDALKMMKTGDSASFIIPAKDFYLKTKRDSIPDFIFFNENLRFEIKISDIVSQKQLEREFKHYILKKETEEKQILKEYIRSENITTEPTASGIYIIKLKEGHGKKAVKGKIVTLHYKASFINGKVFDSSVDKGKPVSFVLGEKTIIPAWNEAVETMRTGDKIRLITSSQNAYGESGLEGYVQPFASLIYDIKLLSVK